ncbi:TetR-like C-terminal domain-containing protein [Bradyrhizobium sp. LTSPM299]|uniref:TetR-like C-terminal domain-containing protein n=1 Tax=Bradyrhizobium sp. LTSPM299 TaxID=1619233 RepID=UPI0012E1740F|nr:TetR-like C-terminal domain-containing protein [Bradyrhizobium sp. LTSPM299]
MKHELGPDRAKLGTRQCGLRGQADGVTNQLHLGQQHRNGKRRQQEFDQDPVVSEQTPGRAQRLDKSGQQRNGCQWDDRELVDQLHRRVGRAHRRRIMTDQTGDRENQKARDRTEQADRAGNMRRERELAPRRRIWRNQETAKIEHAHGHIDLYKALVGGRGGAIALGTIRQILSDLVRNELAATVDKTSAEIIPRDVVVQYVVGAFMAVMTWWLDGGAKLPPRQIDSMFRQLATEGIMRSYA